MKTSNLISKVIKPSIKVSLDDISAAIDIADGVSEERKILREIVKFGTVDAKEIMTPRVDVVAMEYSMKFSEVKQIISDSGYSRYPVYQERLDNIKGILVAKDLIAHLDKDDSFKWQELIREPFFVPESMKIDKLLEQFQQKKTHMAIVIDEYGGFSGIVTLEDVLEEIVGEIQDEYDEEEPGYRKLSDGSYEFEGKFLINDFYKVMNLNEEIFDDIKGDAETLAGMILEIKGEFPKKGEKFKIHDFEFEVLDVDSRHITKIKVRPLNIKHHKS
jgi:gliding motility-associated protein GldE